MSIIYFIFCLGWPPSLPSEDMETSIELKCEGSSVHLNQGNPAPGNKYLVKLVFGARSKGRHRVLQLQLTQQ